MNSSAPKTAPKSAPKAASWAYASDFVAESEPPPRPAPTLSPWASPRSDGAVRAALTFVSTVVRAKAVVEIGTGSGVSGLALFAGMQPDGILTSVDIEPEHQRVARKAFLEAVSRPSGSG